VPCDRALALPARDRPIRTTPCFGAQKEVPLIRLFSCCAVLALALGSASAQVAILDYLGFAWEDGGLPPSNPGDELQVVCITTQADPIFGVNLGSEELTLYAYGLTSNGSVPDGFGNTIISYSGGTLELWRDASQDADWGVFPPNASSPSSFMNGSLLLQATFNDFVLLLTPSGAGAYEGHLDGVAGALISACSDCLYTWGGAFGDGSGAQIPDGYDLQIDGVLEVDEAISQHQDSFGALKALFE
jgi:hypothetical protein